MTTTAKIEIGLPDPLIAEIVSLKAALARYQTTADTANIHMQRQALDLSTLAAKNNVLGQENSLLQKEIVFLRSNPEPSTSSSSASLQSSEMTLALRRLSDQLNSSEEAFRDQAERLARAQSARSQANYEANGAYELVTRTKTREAHALGRVRTLEFELERKEEERKMADLVVREYADLVRAIEGRPLLTSPSTSRPASFAPSLKKVTAPPFYANSNGAGDYPRGSNDGSSSGGPWSQSNETVVIQAVTTANGDDYVHPKQSENAAKPIDSLQQGRAGLQKLLTEFHEQTERLEEEIAKLHGEREILEMKLAVCEQVAADENQELASVQAELANALRADKSVAKMVERYMSFSQQSTNLLQSALQTQKKRHNATLATLERQISLASAAADREKGISERLRYTLDEMAIEISRESFGRRREIAIRLLQAERERKIGMMLEKWVNDMEQKGALPDEESKWNGERLKNVSFAKQILKAIRGSLGETSATSDSTIQMALATVQDLSKELELEMSRRMLLERENADLRRSMIDSETRAATHESQENKRDTNGANTTVSIEVQHKSPTLDTFLGVDASDPVVQSSGIPTAEVTNTSQPPLNTHGRETGNVMDLSSPLNSGTTLPTAHGPESEPPLPESNLNTEELGHANEWISALRGTPKRYDDLQSAFNDCHDTLDVLQASVADSQVVSKDGFLVIAVERLHDYCEDARVGLEILVADEARISQGYETLLSIPSETRNSSSSVTSNTGVNDEWHLLYQKIETFVGGTLPSMQKARTLFEGKLDNLMHDISIIKRAMHEDMNPSNGESLDRNPSVSPSALVSHANGIDFPSQDLKYDENGVDSTGASNHLTWKTLASSRIPASPLPIAGPPSPGMRPAQSFGILMTSSRLRYPSVGGKATPRSSRSTSDSNSLNHLGLRIAMPRVHSPHGQDSSPSSHNIHSPFPFALRPTESTPTGLDGQPSSAPISRASSGWFSAGGILRARTISNIHAVGFGVGMAMSSRSALDGVQRGSGTDNEAPFAMGSRGSRASRLVGSSGSAPQQDEVE